MLHTLTAPGLAQGALYFKFYITRRCQGAKLHRAVGRLARMLALGLTTFRKPNAGIGTVGTVCVERQSEY
jgi:hypothetical protein